MVKAWRPGWALVRAGAREVFARAAATAGQVFSPASRSPVVAQEPPAAQSGTDTVQGAVLQERVAVAWRTYRVNRARGDEDHAARAALHLGALEQQRGNTAAARTAYQHVIDYGDTVVADQAATALEAINPNLDPGQTRRQDPVAPSGG